MTSFKVELLQSTVCLWTKQDTKCYVSAFCTACTEYFWYRVMIKAKTELLPRAVTVRTTYIHVIYNTLRTANSNFANRGTSEEACSLRTFLFRVSFQSLFEPLLFFISSFCGHLVILNLVIPFDLSDHRRHSLETRSIYSFATKTQQGDVSSSACLFDREDLWLHFHSPLPPSSG